MISQIKKLKKLLFVVIILVVISVNSFAATVDNNDGSAFISKVELDSLMNNFQAQLDYYNANIDSKIDYAISSYLAGIKAQLIESFEPYVLVNDQTPKIIGRKYNYDNISRQFYNEVSCVASVFGAAGGAIQVNNPLTVGGNNKHTYWGFWVQPLTHLKNYGRGFEFDENGNVIGIYDDDNIVINLTFTDSVDPYGDLRDIGSWFKNNGMTSPVTTSNLEINKQYINTLVPANSRVHHEYTDSKNSLTANYDSYLVAGSDSWKGSHWYGPDTDAGRWTNLTSSFYATHKKSNKVTDINIYNKVDAIIYAYPKDGKYLENFCDVPDGLSNLQRCMQVIAFNGDGDELATYVVGKAYNDGYSGGRKHRLIYSFPKLKIGNTTTIDAYKPVIKTGTASANQWNTLQQFQNGYMKYKLNNRVVSPKFYGGIPLFNMDKDYEKVVFKIKAEKTSTSNISKIRLWFKTFEFPNEYVNTSNAQWTAINPQSGVPFCDELVKVISSTKKDNNEIYIDIDLDTIETITINNIKAEKPYFMRFSEVDSSGNVLNEGGKIVMLSNFEKHSANNN